MADRAASIRNVALVGHGDTGKTTFAEQALHRSGAITRAGAVPEGNTVSDSDPDEKERAHSIDLSPVHVEWKGSQLQMVDCPGYPDFRAAASVGIWATDVAVLFVNAAAGAGVNTPRMWHAATKLGKARVIVVSRMDADAADPVTRLAGIHRRFGTQCVPFNLPVGKGASFSGVTPCFGPPVDSAPDTSCEDPESARSALLEAVVEGDDALLERYFEGEEIGADELGPALTKAVSKGTVVPVFFLSQKHGVDELLDFLATYAPSSADLSKLKATDASGAEVAVTSDGPFLASVFKITSDVHVGKLSFLRVWSGSLPADGVVWNSATGSNVKLAHPTRPQGKELTPVSKVGAGDVFCVAKVDELKLCATVAAPGHEVTVTPPVFARSMVQLAVTPKARGEEHKIGAALGKLAEEDPAFHAERSAETNELIISGRSMLHLQILMKRVKSRFKLDMDTHVPIVPLKETIQARADGHHRHKKQTGGRGQFGEVYLRLAPAERGTGFTFADKTVGGSIPKNFMPAIEKGIREIMAKGVIAGYEVVDVSVEVYDGKHHPVDSSEAAFKMAGAKAFRDAFEKAKPCLLEPIVTLQIDVPATHMGDVTSDLNTRRGRIQGMDAHDDHQVIHALAPLSEVQTYSTDLRSMTAGEGMYDLAYDHLGIVPGNIAKKLMEKHAAARSDDDH